MLRHARGCLADFRASGDATLLDRAIAAGGRALELCPPDAPERFAVLMLLGEARATRSEATGSDQDLRDCVEVYRELTRLAPTEQPELEGAVLMAFATFSLRLGLVTGAQRPAEEAALAAREINELGQQARSAVLHATAAKILGHVAVLLPADHPDRAALAALHGSALLQWTRVTGDPARLDEAEEEVERAVRLCPPGDPNKLPFMAILSDVRRMRYEQQGTLDALDLVVETSREVLDLWPADHPVTAAVLHDLGTAHHDRYGLTDDIADLDRASHYLRMAFDRASDPDLRAKARTALAEVASLRGPVPPVRLPAGAKFVAGPGSTPQHPAADEGEDVDELARHSVVLTDLLERYEHTGDLRLLEQIRDDGHALLARLPDGHPHRHLIGKPLGPALMRRFEAHGHEADLDEAVELLRDAAERPVLSPAHLIGDLINLAAALINRFLRDRIGADLDEAITHTRRVVELVRPGGDGLGRYLGTLGTALVYRFQHTGRRFDLDEAIDVGRSALAEARSTADAAHGNANLGNRLRQRFSVGGDPSDLDAAVRHLRGAIEARGAPQDRLTLALVLRDRGVGPGGEEDLVEAAAEYRQVLDAVPEGAPIHLTARLGLAQVLADLGRADEAIDLLAGVAEREAGRSFERMDALVFLAGLRAELAADGSGDWGAAAAAFADAVEQLHLTVWRGLTAADRDLLLTRWPDVACDAAAAAIAAGDPELAVELLDHGRSLRWGRVLDTRTDLTTLRAAHPDLAERLTALRAEADTQDLVDDTSGHATVRRRWLAEEWDDLVAAVRAWPGFERFLLPTPFTDLARAAADGPVVLVNPSRHRCDALVLTTGGVRVVPLPDLTAEQAGERTRRYLDAVARVGVRGISSGPREQVVLGYLEWLWDAVAAPVLAAVPVPAGTRLWWCPTGPLALAPLHAAGHHDPDDIPAGRAVLDHVVSSITPTVRALLHARRPSTPQPYVPLVVACDERPGYVKGLPDLPSAVREAQLITARFPGATVLNGRSAGRARVTALLAAHTCAHFACHGDTDADGHAALFLADAPLTAADFARLDLDHAHLAVLSACHTAMGAANLPDEAAHLAAALHISGFRRVISTLWAIEDDTAATVANDLYRELTADDGALDPSRAANALHTVTLQLRRENPYQPSRWAPFVHLGR